MKKNQLLIVGFVLLFFCVPQIVLSVTTPYIKIDSGASQTYDREVSLSIQGPTNVRYMQISNEVDFPNANWITYSTSKNWYLDYGKGTKTVYIRFKDSTGKISSVYKDTIQLYAPASMDVDFVINPEDEDDDTGAKETDSRNIQIRLSFSKGVEGFIISNDNNFSGKSFKDITNSDSWVLSEGSGEKVVYVQFMDVNKQTQTVSRKIIYNQPIDYIGGGALLKGQTNTIYYLGFDGKIHPFLNGLIYHSWYQDFSEVKYVSNAKLATYAIGNPVCVRPGTWLLKFQSLPKVYAVEPGCRLKPIASEAEAYVLYGTKWADRILELSPFYMSGYDVISMSVADEDEDIVDKDRDGLSAEVEEKYGTSDKTEDTDGDNLTDYEEINYWFSDPAEADTDGDGYKDGSEIVNGYSPSGPQKLDTEQKGKYSYSNGSLIKVKDTSKRYYRDYDGKFYYVGTKNTEKPFSTNRFQDKFIINETYKIPFTNSGTLKSDLQRIKIPQVYNGDVLVNL